MSQNLATDQGREAEGFRLGEEEQDELGPARKKDGAGPDRTDPESAREVMEALIPEEGARRACLALLADAIEAAHGTAPASWSVTLFRDGVRLNVGAVETTVPGAKRRGALYLLVNPEAVGAEQRAAVEGRVEWNTGQVYASVPGARGLFVPFADAAEVLPVWRAAHLELVRSAAAARPVGTYQRSHSPGVTEYLERELGRELPEPLMSGGADVAGETESADGVRYWKIAPGEGAWQWEECRREGFIAMGWEELGDCHGLTKDEYLQRRAEAIEAGHGFSRGDMQPWVFANQIKPGDRIVANRGQHEVLGIGTVTGPYQYVPGIRHGHRLPVQWDDVRPFPARLPWVQTLVQLEKGVFEGIVAKRDGKEDRSADEPAFTERAFELLEGLGRNPTKAFVFENKDELKEQVEQPFQRLFRRVAEQLPEWIAGRMESEQNCFGRFLKNDYGQGGAHRFYWGALYPRGGKRTQGAQLFLSIYANCLVYGFSVGAYGAEASSRFRSNLEQHGPELVRLLADRFSDLGIVFGGSGDLSPEERLEQGLATSSLAEWVATPENFTPDVRLQLSRQKMVTLDQQSVARIIASAFEEFFPLVLLTLPGNPMAEIRRLAAGEEPPFSAGAEGVQENTPPLISPPPRHLHPPYSFKQLTDETGLDAEMLERWLRALERKKQAVLYGPPGTGKTYVAERLARHLAGGTDALVEVLQFHPSWSYEEFMQGLRPHVLEEGALTYRWQDGRFVDLCTRARTRSGTSVLIIDEINRANLASVFGELMYLLEYRDREIALPGGARFSIPGNVRVIGTMNTADRSIALVDHALRRRFAFLPLFPDYGLLRRRAADLAFPVEGLIRVLEQINGAISDRNYALGVSFFLNGRGPGDLEDIWRLEIEPYLEELFFDQPARMNDYRWEKIRPAVLAE